MGLRTKSDWQNTPVKQGNVDGMTPKQEDMSTARSPLNFQQPNAGKQDQTLQQQESRDVATQQREAAKTTNQQAQAQQASPVGAAVEAAASKLGNFAFSLRARVNQFLQGAAQNVGFEQATSEFVYNPATPGMSTMRVSEGAEDIDPVVQEKIRQQELLKGSLSPFTQQVGDRLSGKSFGQVVKEQMGEDPQVTRLVQMVTSLQDMDARGLSGTPEALALEDQLKQLDRFGMVSSLRDAMNEYNRMMGRAPEADTTKWYGDAGDTGYSILDIANLGVDTIRSEVENAKLLSSGLFSGDFEENLQKQYDKESAEGQRAARRAEALHSELMDAFSTYTAETADLFGEERKSIEGKMNLASEAVRASMLLTPEGREALQWFDLMGDGESDNVISQLFNALSDENSGLGKEQRQAITDFIGKVGQSTGGQLYIWMESLGKTGKVPFTDADGNTKMIEPSADQKMRILDLMQNDKIDPKQKQEELHKIVEGIGLDSTTNVKNSVDKALETAKATGNMDLALGAFTASMAKSLQTFAKSKTEDAVRDALGIPLTEWNAMGADARANKLHDALSNNPQLVESIRRDIKDREAASNNQLVSSAGEIKKKAESSMSQLNRMYSVDDKGVESGTFVDLRNNLQNAPTSIATNIMTSLKSSMTEWAPSLVSQYSKSISANPWVKQGLATGQLDKSFVGNLSNLFAYQTAIQNMQQMYPDVAAKIWPLQQQLSAGQRAYYISRGIPLPKGMPADITDFAMRHPEQLEGLLKTVQANIASTFTEDPSKSSLLPSLVKQFNAWRKVPKQQLTPSQAAVLATLDDAAKQLDQTNKDIGIIKNQKQDTAATVTSLDELLKNVDIPVFNPDEVLSKVLGMARGVEDIAGGRFPEEWNIDKNLTPENLAVLIPKLLEGRSDPEAIDSGIPPALKTVLEGLGLPLDAWSVIGGIPHIRMSNGSYTPMTPEMITQLTAQVNPNYVAKQAGVTTTGLGGIEKKAQDINKIISGKMKVPVAPKPSNTTAVSKQQQRVMEREFKLPKAPAGFGEIVAHKDSPGWFSRLMGKTDTTYTVELRDSNGKLVETMSVPYHNTSAGMVYSSDGGKSWTSLPKNANIADYLSDAARQLMELEMKGSGAFGGPDGVLGKEPDTWIEKADNESKNRFRDTLSGKYKPATTQEAKDIGVHDYQGESETEKAERTA
jgi:hypothetical protein